MRDLEILAYLSHQRILDLDVTRYGRRSVLFRMYEYRVFRALMIENTAMLSKVTFKLAPLHGTRF